MPRALVFAAARGGPLDPNNTTKDYNRLVKLAGMRRIRIHDLRHTFVTQARQEGADIKAISEHVGHADVSITLRTYAHVQPAQRTAVADKIGAVLFGPR